MAVAVTANATMVELEMLCYEQIIPTGALASDESDDSVMAPSKSRQGKGLVLVF